MKEPLVLYHGDADGFCSAFIAWLALRGKGEYRAMQYGWYAPVMDTADRDVFILDFSYDRAELIEMSKRANSLLVLDHHKTAAAELDGLPFCVFDMDKSGASLTWEHFVNEIPEQHRESLDLLVQYVEDRDLWKWELDGSRAVNAAIESHPFDFDVWRTMYTVDGWVMKARSDGGAILRAEKKQIESICHNAMEVRLSGYLVLAANTPILQSEVAGRLAEGRPFGVAWFQRKDGVFQYSLRSSARGGVDVSVVARTYGGGGHERASGFEKRRLLWGRHDCV